ncbi:MAG: elongation factor G, partial [Planctomycetes bacterium]|nr:elongation factor G [Planctomycetota bacterium]
GVVLLEPVMRFQITTPDEYFGGINQDLVRRRAEVDHVDEVSGQRRIQGSVPLAEVFGYTTTLRSISQGRAAMSLEPIGFAPAPEDVAEKYRF